MEALWQDTRYALRMLRKSPGFTLVAVLTLAFGIGANTAMFTILNSLLIRTLPVQEPDRLATVSSDEAINMGFTAGLGWNYPMWDQLRQRSGSFDGALAWWTERLNVAERGEVQPVETLFASGDFFTTLGASPVIGRTFTAADDGPAGGPDGAVAVISYGLWQRRFGGSPAIVGTPLSVEGVRYTIVGVMPREFYGIEVGQSVDVALPMGTEALIRGQRAAMYDPRSTRLTVMVRLKRDQSLAAGTALLRTMHPAIIAVTPNLPPLMKAPFTLVSAANGTSGVARLRQRYEQPLVAIAVIAGLVLLIACVNIANLLLARGAARTHEMSVRRALGASRWHMASQLLVESFILSAMGAALGMLLAAWESRALVAQLSTASQRIALDLRLDWRVLLFTAAIAVGTTIVFGLVPAFRATRAAGVDSLKDQTTGRPGSRMTLSSGFVVAQVALSFVLVVAAGLFVRTFQRLATTPLGFDRDRVLIMSVNTAAARHGAEDPNPFYYRLVQAAAAAPGVTRAAGSMWTPVSGGIGGAMVGGRRGPNAVQVAANFVTHGWFDVYGIPLRAGRDIAESDVADSQPVVVVNEAFVRRFLKDRNPLGQVFDGAITAFLKDRTVVGVVGDAVYRSPREVVPPTIYLPLAQAFAFEPPGASNVSVSLRSEIPPTQLARTVGAALAAVHPDLTFTSRPLVDFVRASLVQERVVATLSGFFSVLGLLLAALGVYGVTAYYVTCRQSEIGVRMALGADRMDVIRMVLRRSVTMALIGTIVGFAAAAALTRYLAALLFGVTPLDPLTFAVASAIFLVVATLAAFLPARRATHVDPSVALRCN